MQSLRLLLIPVSLIYAIIIKARNFMYDAGIFKSTEFNFPIICIGNLAVGGAGKTPMAEYIIRLLKDKHRLAVLSRGYKRETKGFRLVTDSDTVDQAGDEPLQFRRKFDNITVAVSEERVAGIEKLIANHDLIILDDAFQHRAVKTGLNILLFDYTTLDDYRLMLPTGNLRDAFASRKRANLIVVSKCPENLTEAEKRGILKRIKPFAHQKVFYSYLSYENLIHLSQSSEMNLPEISGYSIFLLTGIANPAPLLTKLKDFAPAIIHHNYPDHHPFSTKNISKLATDFKQCPDNKKIIITTEKDAQRLQHPALLKLLKDLPVYYLPVRVRINQPDEQQFNELIENYATKHIYHN